MNCPTCDGKGITPVRERWQPQPWDGEERRSQERGRKEGLRRFREYEAPFYQTCGACDGSGRLQPGLISGPR